MIADYEMEYGVRFNIQPYTGSYSQADALKLLKFERRVELALESERFFDLVRWGEAAEVLNKFYAEEAPSGIIAAPVGFVHVQESKHMVKPFMEIPKLIVEGRKGGSNLAATLVNAILCYNDAEQLRPGRDV